MPSIVAHKSGWRAQVYVLGQRDSKVFRTQREARAWAAARELELRHKKTAAPGDLHTVRDLLTRYEKEISPHKRGERAERLRIQALLRDFPALSSCLLSQVTTPHLAAWRDARLKGYVGADGQNVSAVTAASVLRDINWLRHAFSIARKEWHWIEHSPFEGFNLPNSPAPRDRRITPIEVKRICRRLDYRFGCAPQTKSQEVALAFLCARAPNLHLDLHQEAAWRHTGYEVGAYWCHVDFPVETVMRSREIDLAPGVCIS